MHKLILFLLFIACKVQGQQPSDKCLPKIEYVDSCGLQKIEIQTLRLLNDSLAKKLQLLLEWQELACPIIENVGVVKTVNGYRLLVNKREMIKPAVRYYKRYKNN
ncbi:MAG: hypothetical protein ACTHMM_18330 [Agriterribacter sp.]